MNAKQRRAYAHRDRMKQRAWAKRVLKAPPEHTGLCLRLFAKITLQPDAFKADPRYNWWAK